MHGTVGGNLEKKNMHRGICFYGKILTNILQLNKIQAIFYFKSTQIELLNKLTKFV